MVPLFFFNTACPSHRNLYYQSPTASGPSQTPPPPPPRAVRCVGVGQRVGHPRGDGDHGRSLQDGQCPRLRPLRPPSSPFLIMLPRPLTPYLPAPLCRLAAEFHLYLHCILVPLSPYSLVSFFPCLLVPLSPCPLVPLSTYSSAPVRSLCL